jgi:hypothetical protein
VLFGFHRERGLSGREMRLAFGAEGDLSHWACTRCSWQLPIPRSSKYSKLAAISSFRRHRCAEEDEPRTRLLLDLLASLWRRTGLAIARQSH